MPPCRVLTAAALCLAAPLAAQAQTAAPASEAAVSDPARLAAATVTVDHVFPTGTYARMMNGSFQAVMKGAMAGVEDMPIKQLAAIGGIKEEQVAALGEGTLKQLMEIYDPAYHQRMQAMMEAMTGQMAAMMTTFEPGVREGLSQAYAKRFTADQLAELNRFFDTPTGKAYAADSMMLFMDPAVVDKMQKAMPELMKQMPAMMRSIESATANLPRPRQYKELNRDERARLAKLLGITEAQLAKQNRK